MAKSKNFRKSPPFYKQSWFTRTLIGLAVILLCAGVLGGFLLLTKLGPQSVDYRQLTLEVEVSEEALAIKQASTDAEVKFEELLALRTPTAEDLALLKKALDLQRQYLSAIVGYDTEAEERARELDRRHQNLAAANLIEQSRGKEQEARVLLSNENFEAAGETFREALQLQRQINEQFPLSSASGIGRTTLLQREVRFCEAEPIFRESVALEKQAESYSVEQNWDAAETSLAQARTLQDQLNREFRGTQQADVSRLERLRIRLIAIQSGQDATEIETIADQADIQRLEGNNLEAANLYEEARRLQRALNQRFPDSPFASTARVAEFERMSQTAQSFDLGLRIERNHDRLQSLLAERRTYEAAELIVLLRRDLRQMETAFPRSSLNDEALQSKIRYLNLIQNDLGFIQDRVYEALLPIPEVSDWRMLRTEVTQALYNLIMGTNPSRNLGDLNPVDSVSWTEAKSFCERLSWILGKPVRLPTEDEFREALGPLRYVVLEDHVWAVAETQGTARPVGTKKAFDSGFYDLLGNVSEWLESQDRFEAEMANHIGGHAQDRMEAIFTVPVRSAPRGERNRMTGFRFVVQVED